MRSSVKIFAATILFVNVCFSQTQKRIPPAPLKSDHYLQFAPNNNSIWFSNNGAISIHPNRQFRSGWEWSSYSSSLLSSSTGLLFVGYVGGKLKSGGSNFYQGLISGKILNDGSPDDTANSKYRVYHITRADEQTQSNRDYLEWPREDGAPVDENGKPKLFGDEQLWFVSNDLDTTRTKRLYGSDPIGLEIQTTAWGFGKYSFFKDVVFVRHVMINKSQDSLRDAFVALWTYYDLGNAWDNFCGVDTTLQLDFGYKGIPRNAIYKIPPAMGQLYLQTPVVQSDGDTVMFIGRKRPGFGYAPISGYLWFDNGGANPVYRDPEGGSYRGTIELYNECRGILWTGAPIVDPTTGSIVHFCIPGDPIRNLGWTDGLVSPTGDRFSLFGAGPFTLAIGDTQEVVYAMIARQGSDRLESLDKLKQYASDVKFMYRTQFKITSVPERNFRVSYQSLDSVEIRFDLVDSQAVSCTAVLLSFSDSVVAKIPMYDDGAHGDGAANDYHFGETWQALTRREGVDLYFELTYPEGYSHRWFGRRSIPLAGEVKLLNAYVESDHLNDDREANPGENIRITLDVQNATKFELNNVKCNRLDSLLRTDDIYTITNPFLPGSIRRRDYKDDQSGKYVTIDIPQSAKDGDRYIVSFHISDNRYNVWFDSVAIPVYEYVNRSSDSLLAHVAGPCTGTLGIRLLHPTEWKDRSYRITLRDEYEKTYLNVYDLFEKKERASGVSVIDQYAHDFPSIDGFKITQGTVRTEYAYFDSLSGNDGWVYQLRPTSEYLPKENYWLKEVWSWGPAIEYFGSALGPYDWVPVKIVFSSFVNQQAYVYLRGGTPNYKYLGFGSVPFRAYDMRDSLNPRQINVAFVEQNGSPAQNLEWMPTTSTSDREGLFIMKSTYTGVLDSFYVKKSIFSDASKMDLLYIGWYVKASPDSRYREGDVLRINALVPISSRDTFIVNLQGKITGVKHSRLPKEISISQNYPNPFRDQTTISYQLPERAHVRLRVFDALGREVETIVDKEREAGLNEVEIKAKKSGLFFYQLEANGVVLRKKMIVLR